MHLSKRGSHVGFILSFVIFVLFILFLYTTIQPAIKIQKEKTLFIDYLKDVLVENFTVNLTTMTIKINETVNPNKDCISLKDAKGSLINETSLLIKDENNSKLSYEFQGKDLEILTGKNFSGFLKIYSSIGIQNKSSPPIVGCEPLFNVTPSIIRVDEYITQKKIMDLKDAYESNYEAVKEFFNIPPGTEFGFSFILANGTRIETENGDLSTSVYVQEYSIKYLDLEGNIKFGFLNIKVW